MNEGPELGRHSLRRASGQTERAQTQGRRAVARRLAALHRGRSQHRGHLCFKRGRSVRARGGPWARGPRRSTARATP
eukprot:4269335-Lingulodinium_polyedra.AAC.1